MAYKTQEEYNKLHQKLAVKLDISPVTVSCLRGVYYDPALGNGDLEKTKEIFTTKLAKKSRTHVIEAREFLLYANDEDIEKALKPFK